MEYPASEQHTAECMTAVIARRTTTNNELSTDNFEMAIKIGLEKTKEDYTLPMQVIYFTKMRKN
jgi:hypothetical protein